MRPKILTVDDSATVRSIVRQTFKPYDCEVLEAADGAEGLVAAARDRPDLILLDITMPVMDGLEMLRQLKARATLKAIPVLMLTAEGGRENIIKIAKMGIRDYLIKPFKEEVLVQKAGRIIALKPTASEAQPKPKSPLDPIVILVVEDQPLILAQIQSGLKNPPWQVESAATAEAAMEYCARETVDLVVISLSLPSGGAFTLVRQLRASPRTKFAHLLALTVKTDATAQQHALQLGFSEFVTKPIDLVDFEAKAAKILRFDLSRRHFHIETDLFVLQLPDNCTPTLIAGINEQIKVRVTEAVNQGLTQAVFDLHEVNKLEPGHIKLVLAGMENCRELGMRSAVVGGDVIVTESQANEATRKWQVHATLDEARASFSIPEEPTPAPAAAVVAEPAST